MVWGSSCYHSIPTMWGSTAWNGEEQDFQALVVFCLLYNVNVKLRKNTITVKLLLSVICNFFSAGTVGNFLFLHMRNLVPYSLRNQKQNSNMGQPIRQRGP